MTAGGSVPSARAPSPLERMLRPSVTRCSWRRIAATTGRQTMNATRAIAIALIVAGALALLYGGFTYTKDTTAVKLGPIELSVKENKTVSVPLWVGVGAIVVGGLLLILGGKKG